MFTIWRSPAAALCPVPKQQVNTPLDSRVDASRRRQARPTRARLQRVALRSAVGAVVALLAINAAALAAYTPASGAKGELSVSDERVLDHWKAEHPHIEVVLSETLGSSSLLDLPASASVSGTGADVIHIAADGGDRTWPLAYTLAHELHHIQQLDLVERFAGTRPHWLNPFRTAAYFGGMAALASDLDAYGEGGFEKAADCYAIWIAEAGAGPAGPAYIERGAQCKPELLAAAIAVSEGSWPGPDAVSARLARADAIMSSSSAKAPQLKAPEMPLRQTTAFGRIAAFFA